MTLSNVLPLPRPVLIAIAGFAAVVLLGALSYTIFRGKSNSPVDDSLQRSAGRLLPALRLTGKGYDTEPTFYRMYQRYVYDERKVFVQQAARTLPHSQWAQIIILETRSTPPQNVVLNLPNQQPVPVDTGSMTSALQKHQTILTTTQLNVSDLRAYLTPLDPPPVFDSQDVSAVLEVFQKQ